MTSASVGGPPSMGIYDYDRRAARQHPAAFAAWGGDPPFQAAAVTGAAPSPPAPVASVMEPDVKFVVKAAAEDDDDPVEEQPSSDSFGHDDARPNDKALRRLAQNREAARKSRLRKKAYIQTLESSRMKLAKLEQELTTVRRQQGVFVGGESATGLTPPALDPGAAALELEYARWAEEQCRHAGELRSALQSNDDASDARLRVLLDAGLAHYDALFRARSAAASRDAFLVLSGAWRAPAERFFLWIGGFRPSALIATLAPRLGEEGGPPLDEAQDAAVRALRQTARQLEDALAQGMEKLQQTVNDALLLAAVDDDGGLAAAQQRQQMAGAVGRLAGLASFVDQADHLRQQTLRNMHRILTPRQAARGMLALADYCHRLRALSSLWAARPTEPA
ncbi:hypothetical protein PR202_gb28665 [Eleusine coracana subsp. coracana]|uniref:Uncharacterized protein n=1 Tax=Eleusine coracana subsp. coracana TaxID=191504 RepID=A0AAV5FYB8_ELECO|nr:hypothetical protein QOZ80_8BG0646700 [Eleusine coracana subsp. coracana]GJN39540.1 hypothetical protein PR202_gb28665 [Eleusine coracana subsp. coracana]